MSKKSRTLALGLLITLSCCFDAPAAFSQQNSESFRAQILIVDSNSAIEKWVQSPASKQGGGYERLRKLLVGKKYMFPIAVTGIEKLLSRGFPFHADIEILSPRGKVTRLEKYSNADFGDPRTPNLVVLNPILNLTFDDGDPLGSYSIRTVVTNGKYSANASENFQLIAYSAPPKANETKGVESAIPCIIKPVMSDDEINACGGHVHDGVYTNQ